ncbi:MAG TPA: outer membrane lipoprotein carrier protein LolA [Thermoanaerobaculia bacterium]|nr:outer membrane lipoprotein carrier protein LolA [Thermoanaerobaculia bacterium]
MIPAALSLVFLFAAPPAKASPAPSPADASDPRALLARIRSNYTATPSVTANFLQTYAPAGFAETSPETGRLTLQAPHEIRFDYDGPEGKVFTFDGDAARQYVAADKQMVVKTLSAAEKSRLPLLFFASPESTLATYEASVNPGANGLADLVLVPKTKGDASRLTLLVSPSGEVKRLTVVDAQSNKTVFTFTQAKGGAKHPDSTFALVPPAGTKILTDQGGTP